MDSFCIVERGINGLNIRSLSLALALCAPMPALAQTPFLLSFDAAEITLLAGEAMDAGNWARARQFAEALLERDPDDLTALTILATTAFQMGDMTVARQAAAAIYRSDADQRRRYEAARLAGLAASNQERFGLGEVWLRRALIVAPTDDDFRQTVSDAAGLRRLNPWSTNLQVSFAPSNNVNGGAADAPILVDGEPLIDPFFGAAAGVLDENRALSGWTYVVDPSVRYRLPTSTNTARTTLGLRGYARGVILSQDAKDFLDGSLNPDGDQIDASYYSTALVDLSVFHDQVVGPVTTVSFGANVGRVWTRSESDYDYLRLTAASGERISPQDQLRFSATAERRFETSSDAIQSDRLILSAGWQHQLSNRDSFGLSVNGTKINSDNPTIRGTNWGIGATYRLAAPVGPASLSGSLAVSWADYPDFGIGFSPVPRSDQIAIATLEMTFKDYSYAGFVPVVTVTGQHITSNINQYEREALGVSFGLRSAF